MIAEFETERLRIKPLSLVELEKYLRSPEELTNELGLKPMRLPVDKETRGAILVDLLPNLYIPENDPLFYTMWIIVEKQTNEIIGGICFHGEPGKNGEAEIGYGIDEPFRGRGYMAEAISGMVQWSAGNEKIRTLKAETGSSNTPSIKALERNGFKISKQNGDSVIMKLNLGNRQ
jgi:[ribosomal protein S5]-alanine N-acetyltransferase